MIAPPAVGKGGHAPAGEHADAWLWHRHQNEIIGSEHPRANPVLILQAVEGCGENQNWIARCDWATAGSMRSKAD